MTRRRLTAIGLLIPVIFTLSGNATDTEVSVERHPVTDEVVATEPAVYEGFIPEVTPLGKFEITHYCACQICCGKWALNRPDGVVKTASGADAKAGRTIAVDTSIIPFGTEVVVRYENGDEAVYVAEDTGNPSVVKGNRIDVYMGDDPGAHEAAWNAGLRYGEVLIINYGDDYE